MSKDEGFVLGDEWPDWWAEAVTLDVVTTHNNDGRWRGGPGFALIHNPSTKPLRIDRGAWVDKKIVLSAK